MRVLALCSYPVEAAATRFRLQQYVNPLREHGIELTVRPFLNSAQFKRHYRSGDTLGKTLGLVRPLLTLMGQLFASGSYDLLLVQREAMFFGPAIFEWLFQRIGRMPMILDLDDATYLPYVSPSYGQVGSVFKFFGKTDRLIDRADIVICGNQFIADYIVKRGTRSIVMPTIVDNGEFKPIDKRNPVPAIGWIGTHSTFPFLESIFPVLQRLADKHQFRLKIVGSGRNDIRIEGVEMENVDWELEREVADFQSLDIGLYPITISDSADERWLLGKSGFKAIQYMAVGVPFVMTPVGVCAEIGKPGMTHFNANDPEEWYESLKNLLESVGTREKMGAESRKFALDNFTIDAQADKLALLFKEVTSKI